GKSVSVLVSRSNEVWNMLFIKVRYQGSRKFIKMQDGFTFADFINEVHSRFGLPARTDLCIFDDTDTEIDEDILQNVLKARPDMLLTARGQNEEFLSSYATSSPCTDTLSQSRSHSSTELDDQTPERPSKKSKPSDDSAAEAKKVVLCALEKNSGGDAILAEYSSKKTLSSEMRQLLVNILVAHMVNQDFSLIFNTETSSKLLERWDTAFKPRIIEEAMGLNSTSTVSSLLLSAKHQRDSEQCSDHDGDELLSSLKIPVQENVYCTNWVKIDGIEYRVGLLVCNNLKHELHVFSKIAQILVIGECIAFIVNELVTEYFSEHKHAFVVSNGEYKETVIQLKSLRFYKPFDMQCACGPEESICVTFSLSEKLGLTLVK
ncbi:hypothetical protein IRJ41_011736, partial [Triplophysa rosa]